MHVNTAENDDFFPFKVIVTSTGMRKVKVMDGCVGWFGCVRMRLVRCLVSLSGVVDSSRLTYVDEEGS